MIAIHDLPYWFLLTVALSLGLFFGSFLNVVIYRLPRGQSIVFPGSHCTNCDAPIRPWDNIPVLSWLLLRGRARCCGTKISAQYPLVELLGAAFAWAVLDVVVLGMASDTPVWKGIAVFALYLALTLGLLAASWIDLEHMILPDPITIGGTVLGIASAWWRPHATPVEGLLGAAIGFLMIWLPFIVGYRLLRGRSGMGLGDAKLMMLAGAWFGWPAAVFALCAGAVQGTLLTVVVLLVRGRLEEPEAVRREREEIQRELEAAEGEERERLKAIIADDPLASEPGDGFGQLRVPFGPFLALATVEYLFFGEALIESYLSWIGA